MRELLLVGNQDEQKKREHFITEILLVFCIIFRLLFQNHHFLGLGVVISVNGIEVSATGYLFPVVIFSVPMDCLIMTGILS